MITATHPSTGETITYSGRRPVTCATFARGRRRYDLADGRPTWTVVDTGDGEAWVHVGWSTQPLTKAQSAAKGTNPYYAQYMAIPVDVPAAVPQAAPDDPGAGPHAEALAALAWPDWLPLTVRTSTRRKRLGVTIGPGGAVAVSVPVSYTPKNTHDAVRPMLGRILVAAHDKRDKGVTIVAKELVSGEGFPFVGKPQRLCLVGDDNRSGDPGQPLTRHPGVPIIAERGPSTWSGHRTYQLTLRRDAASARTVIEWYRAEGQRWLDVHVPPVAQRMGVQAGLTWRVRPYQEGADYGGSWGTYSPTTHTIALHWMIFQFPRELVDYIVAHEVAHAALRGENAGHGRRWEAMVSRWMRRPWRDIDQAARTADGLVLWAGEVTATTEPDSPPAPCVSGWAGVLADGAR